MLWFLNGASNAYPNVLSPFCASSSTDCFKYHDSSFKSFCCVRLPLLRNSLDLECVVLILSAAFKKDFVAV
uniref:Candidate secreted effector n=1 Tax=Meloidogyne incognita TaxID=6306 RepID=A0A914LNK2_MELIC